MSVARSNLRSGRHGVELRATSLTLLHARRTIFICEELHPRFFDTMVGHLRTFIFLAVAFAGSSLSATFNVAVQSTASHAMPDTLYGLMYERKPYSPFQTVRYLKRTYRSLQHSGDGGLYGELLRNRAFQIKTPGTTDALEAWAALNSASRISVVKSSTPVSSGLPNSLSLSIPSGTTGTVGFSNAGYWGINVQSSWKYPGMLYYRFPSPPSSTISGTFTIALQSSSGAVLGSTTGAFSSSGGWKQIFFTLAPGTTASNDNNLFVVSTNGATIAGQTIEFSMFSLFPPTFNSRANGFRMDLSQALLDLKPSFFRFPGGNNLEGQTAASRWNWKNTILDRLERPGRMGDWSYVNTDGMGLYDYLQWIEDMGMQSIMGVWAGYSLDGTSLPSSALGPYIQDAIDQINFAIGDPATNQWAAKRSAMGHPAAFKLKYVEIGNEDNFAGSSYNSYRWHDFATALSAAFPQITFIATSATSGNVPSISPAPKAWDLHIYNNPAWFRGGSYNFDILARNGLQFFQGEYAATNSDSGARLTYPTIDGAVAEAAYMTGFDRNSDIVFAASYAPLLNNVNSTQWTPNLVSFTASKVIKSTSYYIQQMFSLYKGNQYLPSTTNQASTPVQWSVTRDSTNNNVINTATSSNTVVFTLPFGTINSAGTGTVLSGNSGASNTPTNPNAVVPRSITFTAGKTITYNAPALSASVLIVNAH
ncbi:glycoside hydrolase [Collybia nuda]|uniref:non-reducing end alpha-L-arabinofuranosidase n=1 Tax=Collybia nuda TaxID=64659 RepID=A0A9P5XWM4_9AGAR|nr:glycoside hydrolase [Collybia nuda]